MSGHWGRRLVWLRSWPEDWGPLWQSAAEALGSHHEARGRADLGPVPEAALDSLWRPGILQRILFTPAIAHNVSVDPVSPISEVTPASRPCDILFVHSDASSFIHDYSRGHGRFLVLVDVLFSVFHCAKFHNIRLFWWTFYFCLFLAPALFFLISSVERSSVLMDLLNGICQSEMKSSNYFCKILSATLKIVLIYEL